MCGAIRLTLKFRTSKAGWSVPSAAAEGTRSMLGLTGKSSRRSRACPGSSGDEPSHSWGCDLRHRLFNSDGDDCAFLMGDDVTGAESRHGDDGLSPSTLHSWGG